ncbi:MAG: hypothetical protein ACRC49_05540, partial [Plesiomonas sp.]
CFGALVLWCFGALVLWCFGALVLLAFCHARCSGIQVCVFNASIKKGIVYLIPITQCRSTFKISQKTNNKYLHFFSIIV